jgi:hypothetical protein
MSYDIVTYCSANYKQALLNFLPSWLASGAHRIHIFTEQDQPLAPEILNSPGMNVHPIFSLSDDKTIHYTRKAKALESFLFSGKASGPLVFLDVDCLIRQDLSHVFEEDFDIGFTVSPYCKVTRRLGDISSGVLFIKECSLDIVRKFIQQWNHLQNSSSNPSRDQSSLTQLIRRAIKTPHIKFKEFSTDIYNSFPGTNTKHDLSIWYKRLQYPKSLDGNVGKSPVCIIHFPFQLWKHQETLMEAKSNG